MSSTALSTNFESPTIERLRVQAAAALKAESNKPNNEQVKSVVSGLLACRSLADISTDSGLAQGKVLDVVADLGTWLTHSVKGSVRAELVLAAELSQQPLFQAEFTRAVPVQRKGKGRKNQPVKAVVPLGFEPKAAHRRDVSKALAAIVVAKPDEATVARFVARTYATRSAVMTYAMLSGVWYMAQSGRLEEIDKVNPKDPVFHTQAVAAYDLLDVARRDAVDGILSLAKGDGSDLDGLRAACAKSRWLAEREITRIERMVDAARVRPSAVNSLRTELRFLDGRVASSPRNYLPASIGDLTVGQVQRIAQAAGLAVEGTSRAEESEIRVKLKALGLGNDLDRLVPEGLRAARAGQLDEFWLIMLARAEGDSSWGDSLSNLFEQAEA